jgi:peptide/nickel transport system permease protein
MGYGRYVTARVAWAGVVSFIIMTLTFLFISLSPNPAVQQAVTQAALEGGNPEAAAERVRQLRGLDEPLYVRYVDYITNIVTLQWGWSSMRSQPVTAAVVESLYYTAQYSIPWTLLTITIGPLVGLYSSANKYSWRDHVATGFAFFGYAIPNFFFAIILLLIFGVWLEWVPVIYDTGADVFSVKNIIQLSLPVFVLVTGSIGGLMRVSRNESSEFMNADFVKTARAKGVSPLRAYSLHILRPTMVPLSTTMVGQLLLLFAGASLLVEVVFSIPGLGRTLFRASISQDTNLVLGLILVFVFVGVIGNLLQDLAYTFLDPRISYEDR